MYMYETFLNKRLLRVFQMLDLWHLNLSVWTYFTLIIILCSLLREDGPQRLLFINYLLEDKTEDGTSYYELLSHVARQLNK